MTPDNLIKLVTEKLHFVSKDQLNEFALEKDIITKKNISRSETIALILSKLDISLAEELVMRFSDCIGYNAAEIETILNITKSERLRWAKRGLINITGYYDVRAYGQTLACPVYDAIQVLNISEKTISQWKSATKPLSEKQKAGLESAQKTALKNRTCKACDSVVAHKKDLENGLCDYCLNAKAAYDHRKYWLENKDRYVILDTETTGLDSNDQILEIAIIDLDDNVLLDTLVMPSVMISDSALQVHGITYEHLKNENAPSWGKVYPKVKEILEEKIAIAYNSDFDEGMIAQTCLAFNLNIINTNFEDLMHNVMLEYSSKRYLKLANVVDTSQSHRALDDCRLCLEIIKKNTVPIQ